MSNRTIEIVERILKKLSPIDLIQLSSSIPQIQEYVESRVKPINTQEEYIELCRQNDELSVLYSNKPNYFDNYCLEFACKHGWSSVNYLIKDNTLNWNYGLLDACFWRRIEIVKLMIENGADDWNSGLCWACSGGNMEIVKLMMKNGADDWNKGLKRACKGGNIEIVKLMIKNGAYNWNKGLKVARLWGHKDIVQLMIEKCADN
jgi:hypothetical protein